MQQLCDEVSIGTLQRTTTGGDWNQYECAVCAVPPNESTCIFCNLIIALAPLCLDRVLGKVYGMVQCSLLRIS